MTFLGNAPEVSKRRSKITNPLTEKKINLGGPKHKQLIKESVLDENGNDIRPNIVHETIKVNVIHNLPKDMINTLTNIMPIESVLSLCKSNKKYNEWICNDANFWKTRLKNDFGVTLPSPEEIRYRIEYKNSNINPKIKSYLNKYLQGFRKMSKKKQNNVYEDYMYHMKYGSSSIIRRYENNIIQKLSPNFMSMNLREQLKASLPFFYRFDTDSYKYNVKDPIKRFLKTYNNVYDDNGRRVFNMTKEFGDEILDVYGTTILLLGIEYHKKIQEKKGDDFWIDSRI